MITAKRGFFFPQTLIIHVLCTLYLRDGIKINFIPMPLTSLQSFDSSTAGIPPASSVWIKELQISHRQKNNPREKNFPLPIGVGVPSQGVQLVYPGDHLQPLPPGVPQEEF